MQLNLVLTISIAVFGQVRAGGFSFRRGLVPVTGDPAEFAALLPFHPERQPEAMFKTRCSYFLDHAIEKANENPGSDVIQFLPPCKWDTAECAALQDDLTKRMSAGGAASH